ncbi:MAG TPA: Crp/Fnr family transcriptional regulator, partial [Negativicutes bacterium]
MHNVFESENERLVIKSLNGNDRTELEYLKDIPIFADLAEEQLRHIHSKISERSYRKGKVIFLEGETGQGVHYVKTGKVKIIKMTDDGREHIIKILGTGDLFAEALLFNNLPYPATAVAVEDACVGLISNLDLEQLILTNNALALALIKALSHRLLYAQQKIKNLALNDVMARTAEMLLQLGRENGRINLQGYLEITLEFSRQDLANLVG